MVVCCMLYSKSNRVYSIREERDLTQYEFAEMFDIPYTCISKWENGKEIIPIKNANKIANKYGISLDYIYNLSKKKYTNIEQKEIKKEIVGKNLAKLRQDRNLTLRDLAKVLNTTSSTISAYETGKTLLLTAFAIQISKKYKISLDKLYGKVE